MRIARKLLLLAGMVIAAMAFTTGVANAQETEVEVLDEGSGQPCNPCGLHVEGESHVFNNVSGTITSTCEDEFEGEIFHDGTGHIFWNGQPHRGPGCNLINCTTESGENEWPLSQLGELPSGEEHITVRFCLRNPLQPTVNLHCNAEVHIDQEELDETPWEPHHYVFSTEQTCLGGAIRVEGVWETEHPHTTHGEIELVHH